MNERAINFGNDSITEIITEIEALDSAYPKHGIRNAEKKLVKIKKLIESDLLLEKAKNYLSGEPEVVRVIVFDKTPDKNWLVTWHQDKTISVSDKKEIEGYAPWITFVGGALLPNSFEHVAFSKVFISSNKLSI